MPNNTANNTNESNRLSPEAIRSRSQSISGCREISFSETKKVLSYITTNTTSSNNSNSSSNNLATPTSGNNEETIQPARVNIYYQTGTVGVCHVVNHEVREYFHKKASLETVERILRNPENIREMTFKDLMNLEQNKNNSSSSTILTSSVNSEEKSNSEITNSSVEKGTNEWNQKLELVDVGIAVLVAERDKLLEHSKGLEKKTRAPSSTLLVSSNKNDSNSSSGGSSEEEDDEEDLTTVQQGKNFAYSLPDDTVAKVDEYLDCWEDVKCVATNGQGTVVLYESGEWKFTQGIPRFLRNKLFHRQRSLPSPTYVSIGSENQYFISFADGNFEWMGCDTMRNVLMKSNKDVRTIAFGMNYNTFFIVYADGSWQYDGTAIPAGLSTKLKDRGERGDLTCVSLGPRGEWFLASRNGRRWWGGVSEELANAIAPINDRISFMDFGVDGSFMVRYV